MLCIASPFRDTIPFLEYFEPSKEEFARLFLCEEVTNTDNTKSLKMKIRLAPYCTDLLVEQSSYSKYNYHNQAAKLIFINMIKHQWTG